MNSTEPAPVEHSGAASGPAYAAPGEPFAESIHDAATWGDESPVFPYEEPPALPAGPPIVRGLQVWLVIIGALGLTGVLFGQAEMAITVVLAGAFVAAHAADRDPIYRPLHLMLTGVLVAVSALAFAALAVWLSTQRGPGPLRPLAAGISGGAAVLSVLTVWSPLADGMASAVFRTLHPTHVTRLGGRVVLMVLLGLIPGWAASPSWFDIVAERGGPLLDSGQLVSSLVGLIMLSLGGVGFLVKRDGRDTLERLGLRIPKPSHYLVAAAGVGALYLLNSGVEALQHAFFPTLWQHDSRINDLLAGGLSMGGMLLLGLSAGVGEELTMRGALQPKLGLIFTAVVFASLHMHYSWIGMATILLLGIVLGVIRDRTSTTIAILVHSAYDFAAVLANGGRHGS